MADWLGYHKFDPTPFPAIVAVLEREGIDLPAAVARLAALIPRPRHNRTRFHEVFAPNLKY